MEKKFIIIKNKKRIVHENIEDHGKVECPICNRKIMPCWEPRYNGSSLYACCWKRQVVFWLDLGIYHTCWYDACSLDDSNGRAFGINYGSGYTIFTASLLAHLAYGIVIGILVQRWNKDSVSLTDLGREK